MSEGGRVCHGGGGTDEEAGKGENLVMTAFYRTGPQGEAEASLGRGTKHAPSFNLVGTPPCGLSFSHLWSSAVGVAFLPEQSPWEFAHGVTRDGGQIYGGRRRRAVGDLTASEKRRGVGGSTLKRRE